MFSVNCKRGEACVFLGRNANITAMAGAFAHSPSAELTAARTPGPCRRGLCFASAGHCRPPAARELLPHGPSRVDRGSVPGRWQFKLQLSISSSLSGGGCGSAGSGKEREDTSDRAQGKRWAWTSSSPSRPPPPSSLGLARPHVLTLGRTRSSDPQFSVLYLVVIPALFTPRSSMT